MEGSDHPTPDERARNRGETTSGQHLPGAPRLLRKGWPLIVGLGIIVSLTVGLIQLGQSLSARPAGVNTVTIEAGSAVPSLGDYAVPIDAPFDEFPTHTTPYPSIPETKVCSEEQHRWLKDHGRPYVSALKISIRNSAGSGAVTVRDIRTKGAVIPEEVPLIAVRCMIPIGAAIYRQVGFLKTDNASSAVWGEKMGNSVDPSAPVFEQGSDVVYDLNPGGSAELELLLEVHNDFLGSIEATVLAEDRKSVVNVDIFEKIEAEKDAIFVPTFTETKDVQIGIGAASNYPEVTGKPFYLEGKRYSAMELKQRLSAIGR